MPKKLPGLSLIDHLLQGAKGGEVPPSVARMRQKHGGKWRASGGDENRRQTVTVEYNPHAGTTDTLFNPIKNNNHPVDHQIFDVTPLRCIPK